MATNNSITCKITAKSLRVFFMGYAPSRYPPEVRDETPPSSYS